jgi:hypothetical protein
MPADLNCLRRDVVVPVEKMQLIGLSLDARGRQNEKQGDQ